MAIEMIENNDFGNFTAGRQGLKSFPDEDCKNYFGDENFYGANKEEYHNILAGGGVLAGIFRGNKMRKDSIANVKREQNEKWSTTPQKSCSDIKIALELVAIDIEKLTKQSASQTDFWIAPALEVAREWDAQFKRMQSQMRCLEIEAQEKAAREKADTLKTLQSISDATVDKTKTDILGLGIPETQTQGEKIFGVDKKLATYVGAGIGALLVFALILRK
jgi:hypothetical protein